MSNAIRRSSFSKIPALAIGALFVLAASTGFGQSDSGKTPGNTGFTQQFGPVDQKKSGNSNGRNSTKRDSRRLTITSNASKNSSRRGSNDTSSNHDSHRSNQGLNYTFGLNRQLSNSRNSNRGGFRSEPFFADRMQPRGVNSIAGPIAVQPTPPATQRIINQHFNPGVGTSSSNPGPLRIKNPFFRPKVEAAIEELSVDPSVSQSPVLQPPTPADSVLDSPTDDVT